MWFRGNHNSSAVTHVPAGSTGVNASPQKQPPATTGFTDLTEKKTGADGAAAGDIESGLTPAAGAGGAGASGADAAAAAEEAERVKERSPNEYAPLFRSL